MLSEVYHKLVVTRNWRIRSGDGEIISQEHEYFLQSPLQNNQKHLHIFVLSPVPGTSNEHWLENLACYGALQFQNAGILEFVFIITTVIGRRKAKRII
jgi:hypothetical protein